jgi:THO complex subunit 2
MQTTLTEMIPKSVAAFMTPELFESFFAHNLCDIHCPESCYTSEIVRLQKEVERYRLLQKGGGAAMAARATLAQAAAAAGGSEMEIRQATMFSKADEQEMNRVSRNVNQLKSDLSRQKRHCTTIQKKLSTVKKSLFSTCDNVSALSVATQTFFSCCIYPRCMLSPEDATYCAQFVTVLHEMETPGFRTLQYLDGLIKSIAGTVYCVTEDEAGSLGFLVEATWKLISKWRYDEKRYKKEVAGKVRVYRVRV